MPARSFAKTKIVGTWREPNAPPRPYKKVVAIAFAGTDANRRAAEDEFVERLPKSVDGVKSYALIPKEDEGSVEKVVARLRAEGVDGAAVMRVVNQNNRVVYDPGYLVPETAVHVETAFYSVTDGKLVWTGYSETINPKKAQDLIDDVAKVTVGRLRKERLLN